MTEEVVSTPVRVWTIRQITTAAALGGLFGGFILLSHNAALLGNRRKARWLQALGVIWTVLWASLLFCLPSAIMQHIPDTMGYWLPAIVLWQYARTSQKDSLKKLLDAGAKKRSWGIMLLWTLLSTVVTLVIGVAVYAILLYLVPALVLG